MTDPYIGINGTKIDFFDNDLSAVKALKQLAEVSGWVEATTGTWNDATHINVPSGAAFIYQKGDKLRWKQGGGYNYFNVITVADTLLTVTGGIDYTIINAAITEMAYSHEENPLGFPHDFNFTTTPTTDGNAYTNAPTINLAKFRIKGNIATIRILWTYNAASGGTSNSVFTIPVTAVESGKWGSGLCTSTGLGLNGQISGGTLHVAKYDGTTPIGNSNICGFETTVAF